MRTDHSRFMAIAIEEARAGIRAGHGGPFGSVIVRDGEVVGRGHNMVIADTDSTAHGEITAIRNAEKALGTHDLSGCVIYTTGEPCPMCLAACLWANLSRVYYGCTIADNSRIGFRDEIFDNLTGGRENLKGYMEQVDREKRLALFDEYTKTDRTLY